ncbi:MAG TPA: sigma-70 family RNA polymerase sigma factor [Gemmatimonadaceae bacterium]
MTAQLSPQQLDTLANGIRIIALRRLGDADAARDVVQETMTRLLDALAKDQLRDADRLGAFVRGIALHVIADHQRAAARLAPLSDDLVPDGRIDSLDGLVRDEDVARLRDALARLSETDRDVLHLTFIENLSPRAVAARLREPAERIRKRKSRALERLRAAFFGDGVGHDSKPAATELHPNRDNPPDPAEAIVE